MGVNWPTDDARLGQWRDSERCYRCKGRKFYGWSAFCKSCQRDRAAGASFDDLPSRTGLIDVEAPIGPVGGAVGTGEEGRDSSVGPGHSPASTLPSELLWDSPWSDHEDERRKALRKLGVRVPRAKREDADL